MGRARATDHRGRHLPHHESRHPRDSAYRIGFNIPTVIRTRNAMMIRGLLLLSLAMVGCETADAPDIRQIPAAERATAKPDQDEDSGFHKPLVVNGAGFVGVIFPADSKPIDGMYPAGTAYWTPSESDVLEAENGLLPFLSNSKDRRAPEIIKGIESYKRQYRGLVLNGHRQIIIHFFCETDSQDWKKREILVFDGGTCFFNLRFMIETKTFSHLQINGLA